MTFKYHYDGNPMYFQSGKKPKGSNNKCSIIQIIDCIIRNNN